ncbi:MAG TPA: SGNH/GDSL hydrolase family protein [Gammaproteobacteria bacterium]|nr:SGNH/GDSL hydrolase family protein [Gammaproteobacteria bacterium]
MARNTEAPTHTTGKQKLALALVSLFLVLLTLEIGIRTVDMLKGHGFFSGHRNLLNAEVRPPIPFRTFGFPLYVEKDGQRYISSRHGELFAIEKPANTLRIVVFGGSTTENGYAMGKAQIHYPLVLQRQLAEALKGRKVEVINVANSAYATNHSLILLMFDALSWDPDVVIMSHNVNDLLASYWKGFTFDLSHKYSNAFYNAPGAGQRYTFANMLFQHSQLYWFVKGRLVDMQMGKPIHRQSQGMQPLPVAEAVFRRNLRSFVALAKHNGIRIVLGSQALLDTEEAFVKHMAAKPYNDEIVYPLHAEFVAHHRRYNQIIREVAAAEGTLFVDNNIRLDNQGGYFIDFVHYTPKGVEVLGENYAQTILAAGILTRE